MRLLPTFSSTISALLVAATVPLLAGCEASLAARTPDQARLPSPTTDDPTATDPGVTGRAGEMPIVDLPVGDRPIADGPVADAPSGDSPFGDPDAGTTPADPMPVDPRPIPAQPRGATPGAPIGPAVPTGREMPGGVRAEPGGPRLADRPTEWPPGGVAKGAGMPPPPPPPDWDPSLDTKVRREPARPRMGPRPVETPPTDPGVLPPADDNRVPRIADTGGDLPPTGALPPIETPTDTAPTGPASPSGTAPAGTTPSVPDRPRDPVLPDTPSRAPRPADASDDLGAPPGGSMPNPMGPSDPAPSVPAPSDPRPSDPMPVDPPPTEPTPSDPQPADPKPLDPLPADPEPLDPLPTDPEPSDPKPLDPKPTDPQPTDDDPWLPGGSGDTPSPSDPKPVDPRPSDPRPSDPRPSDPRPGDPRPTDPRPADDDPWQTGGGNTQPSDPQPADDDPWQTGGGDTRPGEAKPADPQPADDDPWLPGGSEPAGTTPAGSTPAGNTPAGSTPTPGDPTPTSAMGRTMAHVTKLLDRPGRPDVCGYPAEVVRVDQPGMALTPGPRPVLLVFFDDGMRASDLQAAQLLPMIARLRDKIDFVAIDRGANAKRTRGADELSLRFLDHVPTTVVLDAQRTTRLLRSGRVDAAVVERAIQQAIANPTPANETPTPTEPGATDPAAPTRLPDVPPSPGDPVPGSVDPWEDAGGTKPPAKDDGERGGVTFTPPSDYSARAHVQRLRSAPGDARVPGYPSDILPSAPAAQVFASSTKPCVILFFDNASKASDLQAAAYLELLVRRRSEIDLVLVDVGPKASWDADQKRVVRTYFNHYVPTTVVLTGARAPVKSWYSRVEATALDNAIDDALSR